MQWRVDGRLFRKMRLVTEIFAIITIKLDPHIFPRITLIGAIDRRAFGRYIKQLIVSNGIINSSQREVAAASDYKMQ